MAACCGSMLRQHGRNGGNGDGNNGDGGGVNGGGGGGGGGGCGSGGCITEATERADRVAATASGGRPRSPLHRGHHRVSEAGSRGREWSKRASPARDHRQYGRGRSWRPPAAAAARPSRPLAPPSGRAHQRSGPCPDLGLKPIASGPHPALSKLSSTYGRMGMVRTQTFGRKRLQKSASVAHAGARERAHHGRWTSKSKILL